MHVYAQITLLWCAAGSLWKGRHSYHQCSLYSVFQQANKEQVSPCSTRLESWRLLCLLNRMTIRPERHEPMWSGFVWNHSGISCQSAPSSFSISSCILSVPRLLISPFSFPFRHYLHFFCPNCDNRVIIMETHVTFRDLSGWCGRSIFSRACSSDLVSWSINSL